MTILVELAKLKKKKFKDILFVFGVWAGSGPQARSLGPLPGTFFFPDLTIN